MPNDQDDHVEAYLAAIERKAATVPDYQIALGLAAYRLAVYLAGEGSSATGTVQHFAERMMAPGKVLNAMDPGDIRSRLALLLMDPEESTNPDLKARLDQLSKDMLNPDDEIKAHAAVH